MRDVTSAIERTLKALRDGRLKVRIPRQIDLYRKIPRAFFHATPEVFIQTGGATDFECPSESFRLRTWEVCVMPAGVPHIETPIDLKTPYGILVCMQSREGLLLHRASASERREIVAVSAEHRPGARGLAAFHYLEEITAPVAEKYRREFTISLLEAFFITVLAELNRSSAPSETRSPRVAEAEKLARALLSAPDLSVTRLAEALGCSADYLSRQFREETGQTITGWIVRERVALARQLLADPRHRIAEVGWMCGFTAPSYFIRVFRELTGLTPRKWRMVSQRPVPF